MEFIAGLRACGRNDAELWANSGSVAYGIFGLIVGRLQRFFYTLRRGDTRLLLYPFFVNLCFSMLQADSDNLLFNLIKDGLVPDLRHLVWFVRVG